MNEWMLTIISKISLHERKIDLSSWVRWANSCELVLHSLTQQSDYRTTNIFKRFRDFTVTVRNHRIMLTDATSIRGLNQINIYSDGCILSRHNNYLACLKLPAMVFWQAQLIVPILSVRKPYSQRNWPMGFCVKEKKQVWNRIGRSTHLSNAISRRRILDIPAADGGYNRPREEVFVTAASLRKGVDYELRPIVLDSVN